MAMSPDGDWLATGSQDGRVRIGDPDGRERARPTPHRNRVNALAISPDGAWPATGGQDGVVKLWNGSRELACQTAEEIAGLAWPADGSAVCAEGAQSLYVLGRPRSIMER